MKRVIVILTVVLLVFAMAVPAFAAKRMLREALRPLETRR